MSGPPRFDKRGRHPGGSKRGSGRGGPDIWKSGVPQLLYHYQVKSKLYYTKQFLCFQLRENRPFLANHVFKVHDLSLIKNRGIIRKLKNSLMPKFWG